MRHAEKTGDPDDRDLSLLGRQRAAVLAHALPETFGHIDAIVAARSSRKSVRPLRTVEPLALDLGIGIQQDWDTNDYQALGDALRSAGPFDGRQVLVSWRHKTLAACALALGAPYADPWPESEYDRIWVVERHKRPTIRVFRQHLDGKELRIVPVPDSPN